MTDADRHLMTLFAAALDRPSAEERAAYLAEACGNDSALRARVEALLRAHEGAGRFLEPGEQPTAPVPTVDLPPTEAAGTVIGPYKLLEPVGEGGMGAVWLAQQQEPVKRLVALKLIKAGMDSKAVLARFEAERQALALMDHPNIAKVFDASATPGGRPFFAMELVKGTPITKYCDDHRLTPAERLGLFVQVCRAVRHAHQKGVIHRDLKPSNVLVAPYDGRPVVKVIDFGVAKAAGQPLTEKTLVTGLGAVVGTPEYMSPEQAELNNQDIDTRSDVYSLGVLLYELLTGTTPLTRKRVKEVALLEVLRLVREEEPPRPSTRLSTTEELPSIAAVRGVEPTKLSRLVRGELDWIVMKALEKDRNRRYETANGLVQDVERYLADEPVLACPPSAAYRLRKFARRNRGPVLAVVVVVLLLVAGISGTTGGLVRALAAEQKAVTERDHKDTALKQEAEARRQTRLMLNTLTDEVVDDMLERQFQLNARHREYLKKVLSHHEEFAVANAEEPERRRSKAEGYFRVGRIRYLLGDIREAELALREAAALQKQLADEFPNLPEFRADLARTHHNLAVVLRNTGRGDAAEEAHRTALGLWKGLAAESGERSYRKSLADTHNNLGILLVDLGRWEEAETAYRAALDMRKQLLDEAPDDADSLVGLSAAQSNLGHLLLETGRAKQAEALFLSAVEIDARLVERFGHRSEFRKGLATSYLYLARLMGQMARADKAEANFRKSLELLRKLAAEFPNRPDYRHDLAITQGEIANLYLTTSRPQDAEAAYRQSLDQLVALADEFPERHEFRTDRLASLTGLIGIYLTTNRLKEAEPLLREAMSLSQALEPKLGKRPDFRKQSARIHMQLAALLSLTNRREEARARWQEAQDIQTKLTVEFPNVPDYHNELARILLNRAIVHHQRGEYAAALPFLEQARPHHQAAVNADKENPEYRGLNCLSLRTLADCHRMLADHARLATTAEEVARNACDPAEDTFRAAGYLGDCAQAAQKDGKLEAAKRNDLAAGYADRAMGLLRQAVSRGFKDASRMKSSPALLPLRARDEFKQLLAELEKKKDG